MLAEIDARPLKILLVEDDDGDAKMFARAFQKCKIANPLRRAVDGSQALDVLHGRNGQEKLASPFIVIVDLNLPGLNGIQLISAMRQDDQLKRSIIFVLTTSKSEEDKTAAYNLNIAGFVVKETAGRDFLELLHLLAQYWNLVEIPA